MRIQHTVIIGRKNGQTERLTQDYTQDSLTVGRGGNSDIIMPQSRVALEHLRISLSDVGLVVTDTSGRKDLLVNDALVSDAVLRSGDKIKFGGVEFSVNISADCCELIEGRSEVQEDKIEEAAALSTQRLTLGHRLPDFWRIGAWGTIVTFVVYFFMPIVGINKSSWSSGPISNNHKMIEQDCAACHSSPFSAVEDKACLTCHVMTDHSEKLARLAAHRSDLQMRCAECHGEHDGNHSSLEKSAESCASCHGDIRSLDPEIKIENVSNFEDHPEFKVALYQSSDSNETVLKSLSNRAELKDLTPIKLNHKVHLAPDLNGPDGSTTLECADCHRPDVATKNFKPISFERDCMSCHPLSFDERLPQGQVPHGEPNEVFDSLYAQYAQIALGLENSKGEDDSVNRTKPGGTVERATPKGVAFAKVAILREARQAERELFTKTACQLCHQVTELDVQENENQSKFSVAKPEIPTDWMPGAIFSHPAHDEVQCEECHRTDKVTVLESESSEDVLMSGIQDCQLCHADDHTAGKVQSECVMCHSFHDSIGLNHTDKRSFADLAVSLNRMGR